MRSLQQVTNQVLLLPLYGKGPTYCQVSPSVDYLVVRGTWGVTGVGGGLSRALLLGILIWSFDRFSDNFCDHLSGCILSLTDL